MQHASNVTHLHKIAERQSAVSGREAKVKLLNQLREALRSRPYSRQTEQAYCHWVKQFIYFHNVRHPCELREPEIKAFLTHLAVTKRLALPLRTKRFLLCCSFISMWSVAKLETLAKSPAPASPRACQ